MVTRRMVMMFEGGGRDGEMADNDGLGMHLGLDSMIWAWI